MVLNKELDAYKHYDDVTNIYDLNHADNYLEVSTDIIFILNFPYHFQSHFE